MVCQTSVNALRDTYVECCYEDMCNMKLKPTIAPPLPVKGKLEHLMYIVYTDCIMSMCFPDIGPLA
jgi:hypothetical protein